jgi:hypothetical protein
LKKRVLDRRTVETDKPATEAAARAVSFELPAQSPTLPVDGQRPDDYLALEELVRR